MGRPIRDVAYTPGTNTVTGRAVHGLPLRLLVYTAAENRPGGTPTLSVDAQASTADGSFSQVLTGLAAGSYFLRWAPRDIPLHAAALKALAITKPA